MVIAASIVIFLPLTAPRANAQIIHLPNAEAEDGLAPYDTDGLKNGVVVWDIDSDHIINNSNGYIIEADMTLEIPPLNYSSGKEGEHEISFEGLGKRIDVYGTLRTNTDGIQPNTKTAFLGKGGLSGWDGIYFHNGSSGRIVDSLFRKASNGVVFEAGSTALEIRATNFEEIGAFGLRMDGALGVTRITDVMFFGTNPSTGICLDLANGNYELLRVFFMSHGPGSPSFRISNASVNVVLSWFNAFNQTGNIVLIEGGSDTTIFEKCDFWYGVPDNYYIRIEGSSPLINNSRFNISHGALSVIASEDANQVPSHPILRNPVEEGWVGAWDDSFDNSTINATGNSSVTLQWFMAVGVIDPNNNPIGNAPVWVEDKAGNPGNPPSMITDGGGYAGNFLVTELIRYDNFTDNFNAFNVSSINNSMIGYTKPIMDYSKFVTVVVPFNPVPNIPPWVFWISTPIQIQSDRITIDFMLDDLDPGDNGNMSVSAQFSLDGISWYTAEPSWGSDLTQLKNNTIYHFIWDSYHDIPNTHSTTVYLRIIPFDKIQRGTSNQTGNFTVDNKPPQLLTFPTVTVINTTAIIEWLVDEPADASVWWGIWPDLGPKTYGSTGSIFQSVQLTGLQPGRTYVYVIISEDRYGNWAYLSTTLSFETEIHIQLYKGWNMISIPPYLLDLTPEDVFSSISGDYVVVQAYYASDPKDPWKHYHPGKPFGNDLNAITAMDGLWILMKNDVVFTPEHSDPLTNPIFNVTIIGLEVGWNLVGYPSVLTRSVHDAMAYVPYDMLQTFDAETGQWWTFNGTSGDLTHMEMGRGYWIHCTSAYDWQLAYDV